MTAIAIPTGTTAHRQTIRQLASFGAIGAASTVAYVALYAMLRGAVPAGAANALALVITAVANTAANRYVTFGVRGRGGLARDHTAGLAAFGVALLLTSSSLAAVDVFAPHHGRLAEIAALVAANAAATLVRFLLLRLALVHGSPGGSPLPDHERAGHVPGPTQHSLPFATLSTSERTRG